MTLAVRGVVELFKVVKRLKELNREILGFSISHDHCSVRIYGHYPIIDGEKVETVNILMTLAEVGEAAMEAVEVVELHQARSSCPSLRPL